MKPEITQQDLLDDKIYNRAIVIATMALNATIQSDYLFAKCERMRENAFADWIEFTKRILKYMIDTQNIIYEEQKTYILKFVAVTFRTMFITPEFFELIKENREELKNQYRMIDILGVYLVEGLKCFQPLYLKDHEEIREDVPVRDEDKEWKTRWN